LRLDVCRTGKGYGAIVNDDWDVEAGTNSTCKHTGSIWFTIQNELELRFPTRFFSALSRFSDITIFSLLCQMHNRRKLPGLEEEIVKDGVGSEEQTCPSSRGEKNVYYTRHRQQWLDKIQEPGVRRRAERLYLELDMLQHLRQQARRELLAESRKHSITSKLRQIPSLGPIRSALAIALIQTPNRFRTKRQLWTYGGLGLETRDSGEYHYVKGQVRRRKKQKFVRGLNRDYNHDLKGLFKGAAIRASILPGPFQDFYQRSVAKGIEPTMVRLTLARKIAAINLTLWKKGENFDADKVKPQAA